mgnify:CR=1 FL=1
MTTKHIKRIQKEMTQYEDNKEDINNNGINIYWLENDITKGIFTITCLDDESPYYHSIFIFEFNITDKYPFQPPKVKFIQYANKQRMNPNLYVCGKVCLSLLGTWSGPSWSASNSILSIIKSIQALVLCKDPLCNEPGYCLENNSQLVNEYTNKIQAISYYYHLEKMRNLEYLSSGTRMLRDNKVLANDIHQKYLSYLEDNKGKVDDTFQKIKKVVTTKTTSLTKPMGYHGVVCDTNVMKYYQD